MQAWTAFALLPVLACAPAALAAPVAPECQARILRPVTDDMGHRWAAGQRVPATILRRDAGGDAYCAHGGACVPARAGGVTSAELTNCRIGPAIGGGDYRLVPDPRTMGAAAARAATTRDRVEQRLSNLGFSNAGAGSLAQTYVAQPRSRDARLVAQALAGSRPALATLRRTYP